jgi:DNA-binding LacI/PurR family transcriptional regulator
VGPTVRDIARELGVDASTVSLALRDSPRIKLATRARVREAAERLGYVPNRSARALRRGRSQTIAYVLWGGQPEDLRQSFPEYTLGAAAAALEAGYGLLLLLATEQRLAQTPVDRFPELRQADGALFVGETADRAGLAALLRAGFPIVHLGARDLPGDTLPFVSGDYTQGGRLAAEHLLGHGHRRLAVLYYPHPLVPEMPTQRLEGFAAVAGQALVECFPIDCDAAVEPALDRILERGVTAVFAADQPQGLRFLAACRERGVGVPEDLSLLVFDDLPVAELSSPPLSCIRQPRDAIARLGVRLLDDLIEGRPVAALQPLLPCTLVERASVAAPKERR